MIIILLIWCCIAGVLKIETRGNYGEPITVKVKTIPSTYYHYQGLKVANFESSHSHSDGKYTKLAADISWAKSLETTE